MNEYQDFFSEADALRGSGGIFPKGVYRGKIAGPSLADDHPIIQEGTDWNESENRLRFALIENEALDGDDPGDGWMFVDLTLEVNGHSFEKLPESGTNDYFAISSAVVKLGDLAEQLGYEIEPKNWAQDLLEFAGHLVQGKFTGKKVTFETFHKTTKKGKAVVNITPRGFRAAEEE